MMKNKINKINFFIIFILCIFIIQNVSFAKTNKKETEEPAKEFYSKQIVSENLNNGIKVEIVKSDKYGNDQDEFTAVDINVTNLNMYSGADITITPIVHDEFRQIGNKSINIDLSSNENREISFDYVFKKPTRKYSKNIDKNVYKKELYLKASESEIKTISSDSNIRYIRDREEFKSEYSNEKIDNEKKSINAFLILAIIIIVFVVLVLLIIYIRKYLKTDADFYNFFLMISLVSIIIMSTIFNKNEVFAYTQQSFIPNTEYSNIYTVEVYHQGRAYTFRFRINYKFIDEVPIFAEDLDSDGDKLTDNREIFFMTDRFNYDTDGDGISDYLEIYAIDTDPLKTDTNNNGILDSDEDYDNDKLSNIREVELSTFLDNDDTDGDGLKDGEEVLIYHTNPLNTDTDGDGVSDYEEVEIAKKLGITDISSVNKNTTMHQDLSRDNFSYSLYKENVIGISISGECYGLIENHIKVENKNPAGLSKVTSILGKIAYINSDYENANLKVTFDISNYSLKREGLRVATYEDGKIKLIDTILDDNNISANVNNGYVFVLDINRYVDDILAYKKDNWK